MSEQVQATAAVEALVRNQAADNPAAHRHRPMWSPTRVRLRQWSWPG